MSALLKLAADASALTQLGEPRQRDAESGAAFWRINGYRARLLVWTSSDWEKLVTHPPDAQFHPCGFWCALRLD